MTPTTPPVFSGWLREGRGEWRRVVHDAPSLTDAWRLLLAVPSTSMDCRRLVTRRDEHPDQYRRASS
jgi:hypothetical protein